MLSTKKQVVYKCIECDCGKERPIVNKHFRLCQQKNKERLDAKKTKNKKGARDSDKKQISRSKSVFLPVLQNRKGCIKRVSAKSRYRTSSGELVTQAEINRRYKAVCIEIDSEREPVCEGLGRADLPLSHSHTISRKRCKELGKAELIWDKDNIFIESYHEPSSKPYAAHNIWSEGDLEQKKTLLNFTRKLEYIKKHDSEQYRKILASDY